MPDTYRITVDGGAQLARPTTKLDVVADLIRSQPDGRRHVRLTHAPHCVATIDMQRHTFVVFLHGARLDPHDHPVWATQLSDLLGFPTMETRHDQDPGEPR